MSWNYSRKVRIEDRRSPILAAACLKRKRENASSGRFLRTLATIVEAIAVWLNQMGLVTRVLQSSFPNRRKRGRLNSRCPTKVLIDDFGSSRTARNYEIVF